ncbi:hypothetical protein QZH41_010783 [Actinostola sp. cb2023]|nr:hypothetical protein QZH41_010783 [Actinostola sp. cb2023]
MVSKFGFGALIAKFDVLAAYRNVAIHPSDRALLGMRWRELRCRELLLQGLAPSTRRSYATGQKRFINFCTQLGKSSSIKVYLSAVRALHIEQGFSDPLLNCLRLERVVKGIKRVQGVKTIDRLPITDVIMLTIHSHLNMALADHSMFWAACCLAYFGFLRSAEFTIPNLNSYSAAIHLNVQDLAIDSSASPSCIRVNIKASKTDPFRKGCCIYVGKAKPSLCAVEAILVYLNIRGDAPGPLFLLQSGEPLTRVLLTKWLRDIMTAAKIPGNYSSHSFRIGAATVAARNGVPDHLIQTLGRWSSNAYKSYIRTPVEALASTSVQLT